MKNEEIELIIAFLQDRYRNQLLTEKVKEMIKCDCQNLYQYFQLENIFDKLTDILIENNKGDLNIELILSK
jgi:hypothetical protein